MANSIVSSFLSKSAFTLKEVNPGSDGITRVKNLKIKRATIKFNSRLMRHMLEDGTSVVDCRVILPTEVAMEVICPTTDDLQQVVTILQDRVATYDVISRGVTVQSMSLNSQTIDQGSEMLSATTSSLQFKEVMIQSDPQPVTEQSADASIVSRGKAIVNAAAQSVSSAFANVVTAAKSAISGG